MKLFVSTTSPFARLVMVTALQVKLNDLQLVFVNPWENPAELTAVNPFSQVPALLTDNGNLITESTVILSHIAPQVFKDESQTALISYTITIINQAVRAFGLQRFQPENSPPHPFIERSTQFLQTALPNSPTLEANSNDWGQIFFGISLLYIQLRLPKVFETSVSAENKQALEIFSQRDLIQKTAMTNLEKTVDLTKGTIVTISDLSFM